MIGTLRHLFLPENKSMSWLELFDELDNFNDANTILLGGVRLGYPIRENTFMKYGILLAFVGLE